MAASLRSTRPVAKAVLPNHVGQIDHRLWAIILTVNGRLDTAFRWSGLSRSWLAALVRTELATQEPRAASRRKTGSPRILFACSENFEALSSAP
jgi:hypothetical protein